MPRPDLAETRKGLRRIGKDMIADARKNLAPHDTTNDLSNSLKYTLLKRKAGYALRIQGLEYGEVLDKGLSGYHLQRPGTPFEAISSRSFQSNQITGNKVPISFRHIKNWVINKGIKFEGKSTNATAFLVHRKIKFRGFRATKWLSRAISENQSHIGLYLKQPIKKDMFQYFSRNIR